MKKLSSESKRALFYVLVAIMGVVSLGGAQNAKNNRAPRQTMENVKSANIGHAHSVWFQGR